MSNKQNRQFVKKHTARKNLLHYIHTQSYSRISGFRGIKIYAGVKRNRIIFTLAAAAILLTGIIFVAG
jgi:hypothetical protein